MGFEHLNQAGGLFFLLWDLRAGCSIACREVPVASRQSPMAVRSHFVLGVAAQTEDSEAETPAEVRGF